VPLIRSIIAYKNYFIDFYSSQEPKVQEKIEFVLDLIRFESHVPKKFFKALKNTNGIYEIRVITTFKSIRILCFLDNGNVVVLVNCIVKKSQKTPRKDIKQAERIKKEYLKEK
jgi:phage-related protein